MFSMGKREVRGNGRAVSILTRGVNTMNSDLEYFIGLAVITFIVFQAIRVIKTVVKSLF